MNKNDCLNWVDFYDCDGLNLLCEYWQWIEWFWIFRMMQRKLTADDKISQVVSKIYKYEQL